MKPLKLRERIKPSLFSGVWRLSSPDTIAKKDEIAIITNSEDWDLAKSKGYEIAITRLNDLQDILPSICLSEEFAPLAVGDIVALSGKTGDFRLLFRVNSKHNFFFVTDRCNHRCLMCSQPPKSVEDGWRLEELTKVVSLIRSVPEGITISGGEPFIYSEKLFALLDACKKFLPETPIQVLTNGCAFADPVIVKHWKELEHTKLYPAIPLYGYESVQHDYVVQSEGAFNKTILGILRLANARQRIAIRTVLSKQTVPYLKGIAEWIVRNIPFVEHVAFMGMEDVGYSLANQGILWIDPVDYQKELEEAVNVLIQRGIQTSIYNLPYCVLPKALWNLATQSISDWKNSFQPDCDKCVKKPACSGFFSSGKTKVSAAFQPILIV